MRHNMNSRKRILIKTTKISIILIIFLVGLNTNIFSKANNYTGSKRNKFSSLLYVDLVRIRAVVVFVRVLGAIQASPYFLAESRPPATANLVDHDPLASVGNYIVSYQYLLGQEALLSAWR